jgi:competence ComEA-like helix-hairpin-helix protein
LYRKETIQSIKDTKIEFYKKLMINFTTFYEKNFYFSFILILCFFPMHLPASNWQKFDNCKIIQKSSNDGDSFLVKSNDRIINIRLYFIDCPESSAPTKTDARRLREQTRYFGLKDSTLTINYGKKATEFTSNLLKEPFTLYTAFARAMGRSKNPRVYGNIISSNGKSLTEELVKNGFARVRGIGKKLPDGTSRAEYIERLKDLEVAAMLKRAGIWQKSNSDRIVDLRAEQRKEDNQLKAIQTNINKNNFITIDLNNAEKDEIMKIKGIGSILAERILAGRPYKTIEDLKKIRGIGKKNFQHIKQYLIIK